VAAAADPAPATATPEAATAAEVDSSSAAAPLQRGSQDKRPVSSVHEGKDLSSEAQRYGVLSLALFGLG
jgi:hypothetical protein